MNSSTISSPAIEVASYQPATRSRRIPSLLAAVGSFAVLAASLMPWYRVGAGHLPRTLWQESPAVAALLLVVVLAGAALAAGIARGWPLRKRAGWSVFGLTVMTTIAVAVSLFIDRPGGNAATAVAFGGYPALLGINLVKASAVATVRRASSPAARTSPAR